MEKLTLKEAEDAAVRYSNAVVNLKKQKAEEAAALKILRQYCDENPDTETIGSLMPYTKSFAPKLKGSKVAIEKFIKKLTKKYSKFVCIPKSINDDSDAIAELKKMGHVAKQADVETIVDHIDTDEKLNTWIGEFDIEIEQKSETYFKSQV